MAAARSHRIWDIPETVFREVVIQATSFAEILKCFGMTLEGKDYRALKQRIAELDLDISHIPQGAGYNTGRTFSPPESKIPLEKILIEHSNYNRYHLKKRLIENNLLPYECAIYGRGPVWQGQELVLVLDHINGVHDDNRLENLRFLCPNCNSQTGTFAGKHLPKPRKERFCMECGAGITRYSKSGFCVSCANHNQRTVDRPSREELKQLVEEHGYCEVGRMFGVSDNAIRKWLRLKR